MLTEIRLSGPPARRVAARSFARAHYTADEAAAERLFHGACKRPAIVLSTAVPPGPDAPRLAGAGRDANDSTVETRVHREDSRRGRGRAPHRRRRAPSREPAGTAHREPGVSHACDAQGLSGLREDDGRHRGDAARVVLADLVRADFAVLANGREVRTTLADHGMKAESSHFSMAELRNSQQKSIEWAKEVGLTQMVAATLADGNGGKRRRSTR